MTDDNGATCDKVCCRKEKTRGVCRYSKRQSACVSVVTGCKYNKGGRTNCGKACCDQNINKGLDCAFDIIAKRCMDTADFNTECTSVNSEAKKGKRKKACAERSFCDWNWQTKMCEDD